MKGFTSSQIQTLTLKAIIYQNKHQLHSSYSPTTGYKRKVHTFWSACAKEKCAAYHKRALLRDVWQPASTFLSSMFNQLQCFSITGGFKTTSLQICVYCISYQTKGADPSDQKENLSSYTKKSFCRQHRCSRKVLFWKLFFLKSLGKKESPRLIRSSVFKTKIFSFINNCVSFLSDVA